VIDGGLRLLFAKNIAGHWQSVETFATGRGVPDANYCLDGAEGWVEFKRVNGWQVEVRPEQVAWAERRRRNGGRVFLAARKAKFLWLFDGADVRLVMGPAGVRSNAVLLHAAGGPQKWPWAAIRDLLRA